MSNSLERVNPFIPVMGVDLNRIIDAIDGLRTGVVTITTGTSGSARAVTDSTGFSLYDSNNTRTFFADASTGNVNIGGGLNASSTLTGAQLIAGIVKSQVGVGTGTNPNVLTGFLLDTINGLQFWTNTTTVPVFHVDMNGNLTATSVTITGAIQAGSTINNSTITGGSLAIGSGNAILKADANGMYLGSAIFGSAPFRVDMNGNLTATSATITGTISSSTVTGTTITGGSLAIGSGNVIVKVDSNGIYAGNATFASAPFRVDPNGNLTATSATISGTITGTTIVGATIKTSTTVDGTHAGVLEDTTGIYGYDGSGVDYGSGTAGLVFKLKTDGTQFFTGTLGNAIVTTASLAAAVVTTAKMANSSVTNAILASASVATGNIQNSAVGPTQISNVNASQLASTGTPATVSGVTGTAGIKTNYLYWTPSSINDAYLYEVSEYIGSSITSTPAVGSTTLPLTSSTFVTLTGRTTGQAYTYWVRAKNYSGTFSSAYSTPVTITPVTTATVDIANLAVTTGLIANSAVTTTQIAAATITGSNIAASTITGSLIASSTIANSNIVAGTITGASIASATITGSNIIAGTITGSLIANSTITGGLIANTTITNANIVAGTITGASIAAATITGSNIANTTITDSKFVAGTITGASIASATITGGNIAGTTITNSNIVAGTITGASIASATITGSNVSGGTVTTDKLTVGSFQDTAIANGSFEDVGAATVAANWTAGWDAGITGGGSAARVTSQQQSGAASVGLTATSAQGYSIASDAIAVTPADTWYVSAWYLASTATTSGVYLKVFFGTTQTFASGDIGVTSTVISSNLAGNTSWTNANALVTVPAGKTWMRVAPEVLTPSVTATIYWDSIEARKAVGTANILNAAITNALIANAAIATANIQNAAVGSAQISSITAGQITTGTLSAGITLTGSITVGSGNSVLKVDGNGIYLGNATFSSAPFRVDTSGNLTATSATITGAVNATSGTFAGTITASGTISGGTLSGATITGGSIAIGSSNAIFKADSNGIYLGNAVFASAPFSVDMSGNIKAGSITAGALRSTSISQNLLLNGGFEDLSTSSGWNGADQWISTISGGVSTGYTTSGGVTVHSGLNSAGFTITSGTGDAAYLAADANTITVVPGDVYYISVWAAINSAGTYPNTASGFYVKAVFANTASPALAPSNKVVPAWNEGNPNTTTIILSTANNIGLTTTWTKFEGVVTVPTGYTFMRLKVECLNPTLASGAFPTGINIDDIVISKQLTTYQIGSITIGTAANQHFKVDSGGIYLGNDTFASAPFSVSMNGNLIATSANITGTIYATSGTISSSISIGSGNAIFKADSNGIYLGNATFGSAPFRVDTSGNLTATAATITGTVNANAGNFSGNITSSATITGGSIVSGDFKSAATVGAAGTTGSFELDTTNGLRFWDLVGNLVTKVGLDGTYAINTTNGSNLNTVFLVPPSTLTVTYNGASDNLGSCKYTITSYNSTGETNPTIPALYAQSSNSGFICNSTLDATHYFTLTWPKVPGATGYKIYRTPSIGMTGSASTLGVIVTLGVNTTTYNDQGAVGDGTYAPDSASQIGGRLGVGTGSPTAAVHVVGGDGQVVEGTTFKVNNLTSPLAPTVTPTGTTGAATYQYTVFTDTGSSNGLRSADSPATTTTTGNATLSASNYNLITWTGTATARRYGVYRVTNPAGLIAVVDANATLSTRDIGQSPLAASAMATLLDPASTFNGSATFNNGILGQLRVGPLTAGSSGNAAQFKNPINAYTEYNGVATTSWGTVPVKLYETTLSTSASSITYSSIPTLFRQIIIKYKLTCDANTTAQNCYMQFNADTGANYSWAHTYNSGTTQSGASVAQFQIAWVPGNTLALGSTEGDINITDYHDTNNSKTFHCTGGGGYVGSTCYGYFSNGVWNSTAAVTSVKIYPISGNFITGSRIEVWGMP